MHSAQAPLCPAPDPVCLCPAPALLALLPVSVSTRWLMRTVPRSQLCPPQGLLTSVFSHSSARKGGGRGQTTPHDGVLGGRRLGELARLKRARSWPLHSPGGREDRVGSQRGRAATVPREPQPGVCPAGIPECVQTMEFITEDWRQSKCRQQRPD